MDLWLKRLKEEYSHIKYVIFSSDNSPTQYRLARAHQFYRKLADKHDIPILVTYMAKSHGKGKWDGAGGLFYRIYSKHACLRLRHKNRDLRKFCKWFNTHRSVPKYCQKVPDANGIISLLNLQF